MKPARILQLRPPAWDTVKRHWENNKSTTYCKVFAVIIGVTAIAMTAALLFPFNPVVQFFGDYGLACFLPTMNLLQLRKWNRTLAFPAALLFSAIALMSFFGNVNFNGFMTTLFLCVTFIIGAASDRLSPIYKLKPPLDHLGLVAVASLSFLAVYVAFMFFTVAVLLVIFLIALVIVMISGVFGYRRNRRW